MPEHFGEIIQPVEGAKILTKGFESPGRIIGLSGNIALGTDEGLREQNQDSLILDIKHDAFAIVDGMGGYDRGDQASIAVANAVKDHLDQAASDPRNLHRRAHENMRKQNLGNNGAAYLVGRVENGKKLSAFWAGDVQLKVIDTDKRQVKFATELTHLDQVPTGFRVGVPHQALGINIKNYDIIAAGSDGLWDNINDGELADIVSRFKIQEALTKLADYTKIIMKDRNIGSPDNLTIFLYQILPAPLRGK